MLNLVHIKPFNLRAGRVLTKEPGWAVDYPPRKPRYYILGIYRGPFFFVGKGHGAQDMERGFY